MFECKHASFCVFVVYVSVCVCVCLIMFMYVHLFLYVFIFINSYACSCVLTRAIVQSTLIPFSCVTKVLIKVWIKTSSISRQCLENQRSLAIMKLRENQWISNLYVWLWSLSFSQQVQFCCAYSLTCLCLSLTFVSVSLCMS